MTETAMPGRPWRRGIAVAGAAALVLAIVATVGGGPARVAQGLLGARVGLQLPPTLAGGTGHAAAPVGPAPSTAPAQTTGGASTTTATVTVEPHNDPALGYVVQARVLSKDAKPANLVSVQFYEVVDLLGSREMLIGSATTDGQGRATVAYLPPDAGRHELVVRTASQGQVAAAEGRATFDATVSAPSTYWRERLPLATFSLNLPLVAAGVLLLVWALFAFAFVGTARTVAAGAREAIAPQRASRGVAAQARLER